jgi:DNA gyrase inhibitor GyrI
MEYKIENIPVLKIAFIRKIGPYGSENRSAMEQIKAFAKEHDLFNENTVILGIAQDNPEYTKPENCRYDVCLVISDDFHTSDTGINIGLLEGGKYAVFTVIHTAEEVQKAWAEIFTELISQGVQINPSKPVVERYAAKMIKEHKCEICVPII